MVEHFKAQLFHKCEKIGPTDFPSAAPDGKSVIEKIILILR
jgi:hypothetical protein